MSAVRTSLAGAAALLLLVKTASADERYAGSLTLETAMAVDPGWLYPGFGVGPSERVGVTTYAYRFSATGGSGQFWLDLGAGATFFHYGDCYDPALSCSANYVFLPVGMRVGVGVISRWSVVIDGGVGFYQGFLPNQCGPACPPGGAPPNQGAFPALSVGGTMAFGRHAELTFGLGIPSVYVGVAFL
jgi:hypothetical protein